MTDLTPRTQKKYKWKGVDAGIQCDPFKPPPVFNDDHEEDEDFLSDDESVKSMDLNDPDYIPEEDSEDITVLILSALHYNENSSRQQAVTKDGQDQYRIVFPKYKKGQHTVQKLRSWYHACTYDYMDHLKICMLAALGKGEKAGPKPASPLPMCHGYERPDKEEAAKQQRSRFLQKPSLM